MNSSATAGAAPQSWPPGASRQPVMSIGQVLDALRPEFPGILVSKLRFLEEQGLISPTRAASGYRKYSQADVERLRFVLAAQRDHFWPLRVIRQHLEDMDAGIADELVPATRIAPVPGSHGAGRLSLSELCEISGASAELVGELQEMDLLFPTPQGEYGADAVRVAGAAVTLASYGLHPRHLRLVGQGAARQVDLIERAVAPVGAGTATTARHRAQEAALQMADLLATMQAAVVRELLAQD